MTGVFLDSNDNAVVIYAITEVDEVAFVMSDDLIEIGEPLGYVWTVNNSLHDTRVDSTCYTSHELAQHPIDISIEVILCNIV